jgi:hypothetical protein
MYLIKIHFYLLTKISLFMKHFFVKGVFALTLILLSFSAALAQPCQVTIRSNITANTTWGAGADSVYCLDGLVYVQPGVTLTILPGTIIKGLATPTRTGVASTLLVARGAFIIANGTAAEPIVFTAERDNVADPFDVGQFEQGLWGGLIVLGSGILNSPETGRNTTTGFIEENIEGIPEGDPLNIYGGNNNADSSGVLRYISIRHGGRELTQDNEINGLTLGGVGNRTVLEYIEVYANSDDGIEWFGGAANLKYAVVAFCGDDSYDYDQGSNFNGQFWLSVGDNRSGSNRAGEHDGATSPERATPFTIPNISNVTYIGKGAAPTGEPEIIIFRDNAGGRYRNSIFCDSNTGIRVELNFNETVTSNTQLNAGNLAVQNNNFGGGTLFIPSIAFNIVAASQVPSSDARFPLQNNQLNLARNVAAGIFNASGNVLTQGCPITTNTSRNDSSNGLNPRPTTTAATNFTGAQFSIPFFDKVTYRGAFGPNDTWANWTHLAQRGILVR